MSSNRKSIPAPPPAKPPKTNVTITPPTHERLARFVEARGWKIGRTADDAIRFYLDFAERTPAIAS